MAMAMAMVMALPGRAPPHSPHVVDQDM